MASFFSSPNSPSSNSPSSQTRFNFGFGSGGSGGGSSSSGSNGRRNSFMENIFGSRSPQQQRQTASSQPRPQQSRSSASQPRPQTRPPFTPNQPPSSFRASASASTSTRTSSSSSGWFRTPQQSPPDLSHGPPPASASALDALPDVAVTEEDLKDEGNSTCCVCLEDYELGERVTRLPCGHLLHCECVSGWLKKHCTCPVCRYELRTDNPEFERGRNVRMAEQRPRYRLEALKSKRVHELRRLASAVGVNPQGCLEKQDLVDRLVNSQRIDIIPEPSATPPTSSPSSSSSSSSIL
mmetsp:Transcript_43458/g.55813  ORF Transcript_43458/g.55813 Transcript_43458/m.55813 type:complete len:295 (+) Transcript_43458:77-961(+)